MRVCSAAGVMDTTAVITAITTAVTYVCNILNLLVCCEVVLAVLCSSSTQIPYNTGCYTGILQVIELGESHTCIMSLYELSAIAKT
jgi:hypothetical protein